MSRKKITFSDEDQPSYLRESDGRECETCHQEFLGYCPLNNPGCPCVDRAEAADDEDEEKESDFADVGHIKDVLADDAEADRLTDEEADFDEKDEG